MAVNEQLESFLASEAEAPPPEAPERPQEAPKAAPEPKALPESKAAQEPEDDEPEAIEHDGKSFIPRPVLERERQRRQDWKEKAAKAEGVAEATRRQLDELQRQIEQMRQPQPQPQPQQVPLDWSNPQAIVAHINEEARQRQLQIEQKLLNDRLNVTEMMLRDKIGSEKLDAYVRDFQEFAKTDMSLWGKLYAQANPYGWLTKEIDSRRLHRDVGDDPEAFKARLRAEWEAERQPEATLTAAPALGAQQPSLATVRSVAGRSAPVWSGEPTLEEVLAPVQNRKRPNGVGPRF